MAVGLASDRVKRLKGLKSLGSLPSIIHLSGIQQSCSALGCNIRKLKLKRTSSGRSGERSARHKSPPRPPATASQTALGLTVFAAILFVTGAAPSLVPYAFYCFLAIGIPWRVYDFIFNSNGYNMFYLCDFCYWANAAVAIYLSREGMRSHPGLAVSLLSLSDGPVGAALLAWQCRWAFGSAEHTISTLMHLLPGLAMFVKWHLGPGMLSWHDYSPMPAMRAEFSSRPLGNQLLWRFVVPLLFYGIWQLWYWLVVQVLCEEYIQSTGRDTSYRCLTRRAKKAGNILAKIVLRGSKARRILLYGLFQAIYTAITLGLVQLTVDSFWVGCAWQIAKFAAPLWAGCKHQERLMHRQLSVGTELFACGQPNLNEQQGANGNSKVCPACLQVSTKAARENAAATAG